VLSQEILKQRGWEADYPLFTTVNRIVNGYFPPSDIVNFKEVPGLLPSTATTSTDLQCLTCICLPLVLNNHRWRHLSSAVEPATDQHT
jgi:hypothetical protein